VGKPNNIGAKKTFFIPREHAFPGEFLLFALIKVDSIMNDPQIGRCS
jgi:hypothetical protein